MHNPLAISKLERTIWPALSDVCAINALAAATAKLPPEPMPNMLSSSALSKSPYRLTKAFYLHLQQLIELHFAMISAISHQFGLHALVS